MLFEMASLERLVVALLPQLPWLLLAGAPAQNQPPNFVVIFCDDLGYGDLGCYGHPTIRTPEIDRLAAEGQRWTSFYTAAPVCTPSRAALLTGRLPIRNGMCSSRQRVLTPESTSGLPHEETTLAEALRERGYATACIGKWHLGHLPPFLPTRHGFDEFFGLPYSNDMDRAPEAPPGFAAFADPRIEYWNVPLMRGEQIVERPADQRTLTRRYTDEAVRFIDRHQNRQFFLYLAHTMVHVPLFRSRGFEDVSRRGRYGDVVEEIDWSVGRITATLRRLDLAERTLVILSSDNGPWLTIGGQGGSAAMLRGGKGSTFEGGMRVPGIFWWPGTIEPGVVMEMGSTLDLMPSLCALAGFHLPEDLQLDGVDLGPAWLGTGPSPRNTVHYYRGEELFAVRYGPFKAHFKTQPGYGAPAAIEHEPPLLCHLEHDPSEQYDVAQQHPEVLAKIREIVARHRATLTPVPSRLHEHSR